jgi:hypothetical protein
MDQRLAKSIPSALCNMHAIVYANKSFLGSVSSQVVCSFLVRDMSDIIYLCLARL